VFNLQAFKDQPLISTPFPYVIVPQFVTSQGCEAINADFPKIKSAGSFPLQELQVGDRFQTFIELLEGNEFRQMMAEKFNICLDQKPTMITVRGKAQAKDGRIHTDSKTKIITVLIYLNPAWENSGGRLRLLRSPDDITDYIAEVPPVEGTLLAFKVTPHSWHGHLPFVGERRVIQLNWIIDQSVVDREVARHQLSSKIKRLKSWVSSILG
jgi:hypothetical protein